MRFHFTLPLGARLNTCAVSNLMDAEATVHSAMLNSATARSGTRGTEALITTAMAPVGPQI
eukprot:CAMPEP_0119330932 /NCGR_PEP_ID=MMETSP1333-20130426/79357_1 /TAXON_ID=418940 /ORGANISM="Scyphosphaera apsteinii, Strain RCC1455" /LENGTH=60 /DNA_ID=CAMNT_0007340411 /DNA_START=295 /DNA_END=477 /DNA_ORIENTATION=+